MANRPKHRESRSEHCKERLVIGASGPSPLRASSLIGFCSFEKVDPEEDRLRAALKNAEDFIWRRLELAADPQGPMPSATELSALRPCAVIVALRVADVMFVEPLFARLRLSNPRLPILVAPCGLTTDEISQVLAQGAADFLLPPYSAEGVVPRLRRLARPRFGQDSQIEEIKAGVGLRQIVGESPVFLAELSKLSRIAACDASVFIRGESGTGKEVFARAIHYLSERAGQPFVPVNCGAIPGELVESELFGYRRGAFTGAIRDGIGLVGEANGGTMLLDEVDSLPPAAQVKLLRFLDDGEFRPLGTSKTDRASVRVIAATNADMEQKVREQKFREDLYYRLNVLKLVLPPLRERCGDLPLLVRHILERQALTYGCKAKPISAAALDCMAAYRWPGNVRELENVLIRALVLSQGAEIQVEDLALQPGPPEPFKDGSFRALKAQVIRDFELGYLQTMLNRHGGNITRAAHAAGKNRRAFWELLRKHGISLPQTRSPAGTA
jgi:two-component system, NtrC family, response regulator GlrR